MATTNDPILHGFAYGLDFLREQVAAVPSADLVVQAGGVVNHPAWTIGHLAFSCQEVGGVLGVVPWLPDGWAERYGPGSTVMADPARYSPKEEALAVLDDARDRVMRAVAALDPSRLADPFPNPSYRAVFPSIRHFLTQVLVGHTAFHIGQVAAWRRAMGLPPPGRSFQ